MNLLSNGIHGWHNVVNSNGVTITIVGMLLVFSSLAVISIIIKITPMLLKIVDKYFPEEEDNISKSNVKKVSETEVIAAIGLALHHSMQTSKK